jgi:hypothetical protein
MNNQNIESDSYDRGIIPAETAARKEREGENFKHIPESDNDQGIDTTGGYTVDKEGLLNNYAIEPEMYYEEPGDAREHEEQLKAERTEEMREINEDKQGELTMEDDKRGKGQGVI